MSQNETLLDVLKIDENLVKDIKLLSQSYTLDSIDKAVFTGVYQDEILEGRIEFLLLTHGVINVMNTIDILNQVKKGH